MELKKHVVKGMAWTFAEKALTAVFQMFVGLVLMNFLFPDDYGTIQILVVFTSVCSVFVDSGFSAALIRRKEVGQAEYSAVFFSTSSPPAGCTSCCSPSHPFWQAITTLP